MEVVFTINNSYTQHLVVTIISLLKNNSSTYFNIHIISSDLRNENIKLIKKVTKKGHCQLFFYNIKNQINVDFKIDGHASSANYFRLFLSNILPTNINKVIYLDSDLIILGEINQLWFTNIEGFALAAVNHENIERSKTLGLRNNEYFNSGVMLINLKWWRINNIEANFLDFIKNQHEKIKFWDQDVLNYTLSNYIFYLDEVWNFTKPYALSSDIKILHFIGKHKPWDIHYKDNMNKRLYFKYLLKTPWKLSALKYYTKNIINLNLT